eukprot:TRINITY_DN1595_c0_g1_i1.p1 TRINITY_DN1595_c0_g1~~TRINITY_DN1595_c0_g1_i1.p1  ORF type:complete len:127 (-),score=30.40 TRINITY_DN1595_c0_g1_i1:42-422(-)
MPSNLELTKTIYAAFGAGNLPGILEHCDPNIKWTVPAGLPWSGPFQGKEGVAAFFSGLLSQAVIHSFVPRHFSVSEDGSVVSALIDSDTENKVNGKRAHEVVSHYLTFKDGLVVSFEEVYDPRGVL